MAWTVRNRITVLATAIVLVVLALTGAALAGSQYAVLVDNVDEVLQRHNAEIVSRIDGNLLGDTISGQGDDEAFAIVTDAAGAIVASTTQTFDGEIVRPPQTSSAIFSTALSADGQSEFRIMTVSTGTYVIVNGTPLDDVNDSVAALVRGLVVAVPSAALLLAAVVWMLVGRVLAPVEQIRREVSDISGTSLDRRVVEPRTGDEIARLAQTMNRMLERVEMSTERQRRFVADASHELRTPLARIRAELEVNLAHPDTADLAATHQRILVEAGILQRLIDDLLTLARSDGNNVRTRWRTVDLDDVVLEEVGRLGAPPGVTIHIAQVSGAQVTGDPAMLGRIVRNLLDNAVQHGGSAVTISLAEEGQAALLSISDDGPGVPLELQDRIFERFTRIDEDRAYGSGGSGLGLAIVRELVEAHHGTVTVGTAAPRGARFQVALPLAGSVGADGRGHGSIGSSDERLP